MPDKKITDEIFENAEKEFSKYLSTLHNDKIVLGRKKVNELEYKQAQNTLNKLQNNKNILFLLIPIITFTFWLGILYCFLSEGCIKKLDIRIYIVIILASFVMVKRFCYTTI